MSFYNPLGKELKSLLQQSPFLLLLDNCFFCQRWISILVLY